MDVTMITKKQACQFMISYHHLTDDTLIINSDRIVDFIKQVGCIQFDPLNVVGRNPDLVLQSRFKKYKKGDLEKYLYKDRLLFDVWDKNMSICSVEDWAYFSRFRRRYLPWCEKHNETIEKIKEYLDKNEYACSSDFDFEEKVGWHYGPQRLAKAALECMCYAGLAIVHHKAGTRRYYCLSEKQIPKELLNMPDPNKTEEDYYKWVVLRRINSVGLLGNRPSDAWLGIDGLKSTQRNIAFESLLKEGKIIELLVEGLKYSVYISKNNIDILNKVLDKPIRSKTAYFIAPLDNILWDRKLIADLFGFEYKWEVYTPAKDRKYGYYVLPVLCNDSFIGRIEMETNKKDKMLLIKNFWWEDNIKSKKYQKSINNSLEKFCKYNDCKSIKLECNFSL